jgi:hypothetical protein
MIARILSHFRPSITDSARILGKRGAEARASQHRERVKAKARWLREQCGMPPDGRLA